MSIREFVSLHADEFGGRRPWCRPASMSARASCAGFEKHSSWLPGLLSARGDHGAARACAGPV